MECYGLWLPPNAMATTAYLQSVLNQETNDVAIENIRIACLKINGRSSTPATLALLRSEFVPSILKKIKNLLTYVFLSDRSAPLL